MTKLQMIADLLVKVGTPPWLEDYLISVGAVVTLGDSGNMVVHEYTELPEMVEVRNGMRLNWEVELTFHNMTREYSILDDDEVTGAIALYIANDLHYGVEEFIVSGLKYRLHIMVIPVARLVKAVIRFEGGDYGTL